MPESDDTSWYQQAQKMGLFDKTYKQPNMDPRLPSALPGVSFSPDRTAMFVGGQEHRTIMSAPGYYISIIGIVRNVHGRVIRVYTPRYGQPNVQLAIGLRPNVKRTIESLLTECWLGHVVRKVPEGYSYLDELWRVIPEFPLYMMNSSGDIRRIQTKKLSVQSPKTSAVMMVKDGKQYGRSANKIRRELFGTESVSSHVPPVQDGTDGDISGVTNSDTSVSVD